MTGRPGSENFQGYERLRFSEGTNHNERDGPWEQRRRPGRPEKRLNSSLGRSLVRLFVTTNEPWSNVEKAVENSGGPK